MKQLRLKQTFARLKKIKIKLNFRKHEKTTIQQPTPKTVPRGYKVAEKYPLYEPFAHVAIAQNPARVCKIRTWRIEKH